jgi:hypothetical protein
MASRLPLYKEVTPSDRVDAWLECDGQHLPLKRVVDELEPVMLPGSPTTGAEAEAARELAERMDDVRIAAAILAGAAEKAELAIETTRYIRFVPIVAQREWVRPLIAARQPLQHVIESCAAFEDALAGHEGGRQPGQPDDAEAKPASDSPRPLTALERTGLGVTPGN